MKFIVHLDPGYSSSAYEECISRELSLREVQFSRQVPLRVDYKGLKLDCAYRLDLLVDSSVVVEIKAVTAIEPIHEAQILTYMRLGGWGLGLPINFNVPVLRNGVKRMILSELLNESTAEAQRTQR